MDVESEETVDSPNDTEQDSEKTVVAEETVTDTETESEPEHTEFEKKQFERAKKAEAENKRLKEQLSKQKPQTSQDGDLSQKDIYTLFEARVPQEDIDVVKKYAKLNDTSVAEALKDGVLKTILKEKAEQRASADVANTGGSRRGSNKVSDETLISNADKGIMPETDEDMNRLWKATHKKTQ